jgi:hypothetical protein
MTTGVVTLPCHSCPRRGTGPRFRRSGDPKSFRVPVIPVLRTDRHGVRPAAQRYPPLIPDHVRAVPLRRGPVGENDRRSSPLVVRSLTISHDCPTGNDTPLPPASLWPGKLPKISVIAASEYPPRTSSASPIPCTHDNADIVGPRPVVLSREPARAGPLGRSTHRRRAQTTDEPDILRPPCKET